MSKGNENAKILLRRLYDVASAFTYLSLITKTKDGNSTAYMWKGAQELNNITLVSNVIEKREYN